MENFVIPAWVWLNAGILIAAAAYTAVRLRGAHRVVVGNGPLRPVRAG
jgi:uncharacterized membrane protein YecN with MAPEG domain